MGVALLKGTVIPAKAGIHCAPTFRLDSRLRGNDKKVEASTNHA